MAWRWQVLHLLYISVITVITVDLQSIETATTIPFPPTMIQQPPSNEQLFQVSQSQEETDKSFMLKCQANGNPKPTYQWLKNGDKFDHTVFSRRISQIQDEGTLEFTKPDDIDEGIYQCLAENEHGVSASNSVFLRKSELNSFLDDDIKEVYVMEGDALTIRCNSPMGYPKPTLFWIIQSNTGALKSINSSRLTVDPNGDLHFSNVTKDDALDDATYACSATSVFRNEYKLGSRITISVEPAGITGEGTRGMTEQYVSPTNVVALRNENLKLYCIFSGNPLPTVKWSKRGGDLQSGRILYENFGKTLHIRRVDFQDEGTYECTVENGVGVPQTHTMAVKVQAVPYWIVSPNDTSSAEEETVKFECSANGIPEPTLEWFVNGVPLEDVESNPRRSVSGNALTIENLEKSDTAVYQCNASNVHGYTFADFYLNVLALPPNILERPEPLSMAVIGSTVTLRCRVFGAPKPEIKWQRDGQNLEGPRFTLLDSGDLEIKDVLKDDEGDYICYASNRFGDKEAMGRLEIKAKTKIIIPPKNFDVAASKSATFRCEADGDKNLKLEIEWLFNDKPIDFDLDQRIVQPSDNSLTITKTMESDSGTYTCIAKTSLDEDRASAILTVQDVPNPPKITGISCDGLTALVEWQPKGDRQAPITGYTIQFNTSFTPDEWEDAFVSIPAPDTRFKVSMTPWANYSFRVIAKNKIGPSLPSAPSTNCTTPPDVPYRNPDNVRGFGTRKDNLHITWRKMPMIEQNAPGFFYKVFYKREDVSSTWNIEDIRDWEKNELIIEDQPTFKPYRIKVEAHNEKGQAHVAATEHIGYSGEDVPSDAPKNFKLLNVNDAKTALFSWDPVSAESVRGHFKGYKIQTWTPDKGENNMQEMTVQSNDTRALVSIFRPFSPNLVHVRVFNEMYNGPPSDVIEFNTPEGTPGPVTNFDAIAMGSTALYLIWKKPSQPNGELTGYKIYYQTVNGTTLGETLERLPEITDSQETRAKLAGLIPDTKYRVTIHALTSKGEGTGYFLEARTNKKAVYAPDIPDLLWSRLPDVGGKAGIKVTWVPAVEGHPGSHFYVQYKRKGDAQWESTEVEKNQDSVIIRGLDLGALYELKVVAVDGTFQTSSKTEEIETGGLAMTVPESSHNIATAAWFIGMMCAIALLLLLLIIVCLIKRNRGGKYSVHEKEAAQGRDLDYPEEGGFNEYNKPVENQNPPRGSRTSLNSSIKGPESETDSMVEYGEGENSKFTEDGSFIGQYGAKKKKEEDTTSPSALATFV